MFFHWHDLKNLIWPLGVKSQDQKPQEVGKIIKIEIK